MTKYVTTEEQLQCMFCEILCVQRELVDGKYCPNCHTDFSTTMLEVVNGRLIYVKKVTGKCDWSRPEPRLTLDELLRVET